MFYTVVSRFQFATSKYYISQFQNTIVSSHISACTTANFGGWTSANVQFSLFQNVNRFRPFIFALSYTIHGSIQLFKQAKAAGVLCALCIECFSKFCGCSRKVQLNKFHWSEIASLGNLVHFMNGARSLRNRPASSGNIHMNTSLHFTHPLVFRCIAIFAEIVEGALIITAHSLHENNRNA